MAVKSLDGLFYETLKGMCYVEKKRMKTLPKMVKKVSAPGLKDAIESHLAETETHVERLESAFESIGKMPVAKKCEALEGLLKEAEEVTSEIEDAETRDAAEALSATLDEEKQADEKLSGLAEDVVNQKAAA